MVAPAIFILGSSARELAEGLRAEFGGEIVDASTISAVSAGGLLRKLFAEQRPILALCSTGIIIRSLAAVLDDKTEEPPVVAIASDGSAVIPLLGGHRGANQWARRIATYLKVSPAITTASDVQFSQSFDEPPAGYVLGNPQDMKVATAARLRGEDVNVTISECVTEGSPTHIVHHPQTLSVGVGCERGTSAQEVQNLIQHTLAQHGLSPRSVASHASIDIKEDEPAIRTLPNMRFFTRDELRVETPRLQTPSKIVEAEIGVAGVAEAAALAAAGPHSKLIVPKTKSARATCAIAQSPEVILDLRGRPAGHLDIIGLGPGDAAFRSTDVTMALLEASDWVGYGLYLDLAADLRHQQIEHRFALGEEEARCRHALKLAAEGKRVALICSGDATIYAMAALVYELLDREPSRVSVTVHPGISAFQMASARAGALIGHDFCCISLSDLLTPWAAIEKRIKAAAEGDFVTAFYNPRSLKRVDQIEKAFDLLKPHRVDDTPVIIASNLGRPQENLRVIKLSQFNAAEVDMLTIVLVGSSQSKILTRGDGTAQAYTPRGYAKKMDKSL